MRPNGWRIGATAALMLLVGIVVLAPPRLSPVITGLDFTVEVEARPLATPALAADGPLHLAGAWRLHSDAMQFHSLSGLAPLAGGALLAVNDRGMTLDLPRPGESGPVRMRAVAPDGKGEAYSYDTEAIVTGDDGLTWVAVESGNAIVRFGDDRRNRMRVAPEAMAGWSAAMGPESLVRMPDGRFLVLGEGNDEGSAGTFPGLVFSGDPIELGEPWLFHLALSDGFRPVEAATLSDGRVLVLGRWFGFPFRFASALYIFDMADAKPAGEVRARFLGRIDPPGLRDNYEGMAVEEDGDDLVIWVVSDSNEAQILQSTMLLKLETRKSAL